MGNALDGAHGVVIMLLGWLLLLPTEREHTARE